MQYELVVETFQEKTVSIFVCWMNTFADIKDWHSFHAAVVGRGCAPDKAANATPVIDHIRRGVHDRQRGADHVFQPGGRKHYRDIPARSHRQAVLESFSCEHVRR